MSTHEPSNPEDEVAPDVEASDDVAAEADVVELNPEAAALQAKLEATEAQLADLQARLRAVSKAYKDQRDEMAAFQKRVEAQDKVKLARREFEVARIFFDPVQNLQRSLDAGFSDEESFVSGVRMIHQQFLDGLHKLGFEEVAGQRLMRRDN